MNYPKTEAEWGAATEPLRSAVMDATLARMTADVREVNTANGWHDTDRTVGDGLALIHSEVSEWLEAFRSWGLEDATDPEGARKYDEHRRAELAGRLPEPCTASCQTTPPKPEGVGSEAATVLIRLLDECDRQGINLGAEFRRKLAHNRTRSYRHGGRGL